MKVIIESPYKDDIVRNTDYAKRCMIDSLNRGESPLVFHLLYTQVLDETNEDERYKGISASFIWHKNADKLVVYEDYGITYGMELAINLAKQNGVPIEKRKLNDTTK